MSEEEELNPIRVAAEELRAAAEDMEEAAWREGVRPSGPLGVWVQAARRTLVSLADIVERQSDAVTSSVANARATRVMSPVVRSSARRSSGSSPLTSVFRLSLSPRSRPRQTSSRTQRRTRTSCSSPVSSVMYVAFSLMSKLD